MTASATPTDFEQAMLELINRARANPPAEAQRLLALSRTDPLIEAETAHWDMNAVVAKISSYAPEPPLAFNPRLIEAARAEDISMLAQNSQRHAPAGFLNNPGVAVASDGQVYFDTTGATWATGENIYGFSGNVNSQSTIDDVNYFYAGFMIDWGNPDFGHLANILAPGPAEAGTGTHLPYSEIGIGLLTDVVPTAPPDPNPPDPGNLGLSVGPDLVAQEFGWRSTAPADLTGTLFVDRAHTGFYAPGEGLGGVTITAVARGSGATYQAQTWSSGGYTLPLPIGTYDVTASGGGLAGVKSTVVAIGGDNAGWSVVVPPTAAQPVPADYSGDGKTDLAVYASDTGTWTIRDSSNGAVADTSFGWAGVDLPVPGKYDGGTKAEIAVYRPGSAQWFIDAPGGVRVVQFGWAGHDIPVPGDYEGNGKTDIAVYRPSTAQWFIRLSTGATEVYQFGEPGVDQPVPADYDGTGKVNLAVFRPTTAEWFIKHADGPTTKAQFGWIGRDQPMPADYFGDGKADIAVYRPDTAEWFLRQPTGATVYAQFGWAGLDLAVPGDYTGTGQDDIAVFRPATGDWFDLQSGRGQTVDTVLGQSGSTLTALAQLRQNLAVPSPWYSWTTPIPAAVSAGGSPSTKTIRTVRPASVTPAGPHLAWERWADQHGWKRRPGRADRSITSSA